MTALGTTRRRLRLRFAAGLSGAALIGTAATGWLVVARVSTADEAARAGAVAGAARRAVAAGELRASAAGDAMRRLALQVGRETPAPQGSIDVLASRAVELAAVAGLDVLTAQDEAGVILASLHWAEQRGLSGRAWSPTARAVPRRVEHAAGSRVALVADVVAGTPAGDLRLSGGLWLANDSIVDTQDAAMAWIELGPDAAPPTLSRSARQLDLRALTALAIDRSSTGDGRLPDVEGRGWSFARSEIEDPEGRPLAVVLSGVAAPSLEALRGGLTVAFAALAAGLAVLAALVGVRVADRVAQPIDRLVRAVEAVRAGEADYTFPRGPRDELGDLAAAFSRLQVSVDFQRERARAAEQTAAWRDVARQVAHEVKNPLMPIRLTVENLRRARAQGPEVFDELFDEGARTILEEVDQLSRLVGEFSEYARLPPPRPSAVDLHALIDGVLDLYDADPQLEIVRSYTAAVRRVQLDPEQMGRVLKNLVGNAVEAIRGAAVASPRIELTTCSREGTIDVEIADNGPGLEPGVRERLFRPDFTTKSGGTGLGLAISARIVSEHGGVIEATNRPSGGASFVIRLPLASLGASPAADRDEVRA